MTTISEDAAKPRPRAAARAQLPERKCSLLSLRCQGILSACCLLPAPCCPPPSQSLSCPQCAPLSFCRQKAPPGQMWAYSVGFTLLPHLGGFLGWFLTRREIPAWYRQLKKPSWCPSPRVFPLAWAVLYTSMGYASYLVWKDLGGCGSKAIVPLGLYGAQLALSWAWPPLFFGARSLKLALAELLCLDCVAIGTACAWFGINRLAVLLLLPQLCWLCMASCLCLHLCLRQDSPEAPPKSD